MIRVLRPDSLAKLLELCYEHRNYEGLIILNSYAEQKDFITQMHKCYLNNTLPGVSRITPSRVEFENGSYISVGSISWIAHHIPRYNGCLIGKFVNLTQHQADMLARAKYTNASVYASTNTMYLQRRADFTQANDLLGKLYFRLPTQNTYSEYSDDNANDTELENFLNTFNIVK